MKNRKFIIDEPPKCKNQISKWKMTNQISKINKKNNKKSFLIRVNLRPIIF